MFYLSHFLPCCSRGSAKPVRLARNAQIVEIRKALIFATSLSGRRRNAFLTQCYGYILALETCLVVAWHPSQLLTGDVITQPKNNHLAKTESVGEIAAGSSEEAQVLLLTDRGYFPETKTVLDVNQSDS